MTEVTKKQTNRNIYEAGFLLVPTLNEQKISEIFVKIKNDIVQTGISVIAEEAPKMKVLSYEIDRISSAGKEKFDRAYFGWIKFEGDGSKIALVKKVLVENADVFRQLIVKTARENFVFHLPTVKVPEMKTRVPKVDAKPAVPPTEASIAEIDKSIEELINN